MKSTFLQKWIIVSVRFTKYFERETDPFPHWNAQCVEINEIISHHTHSVEKYYKNDHDITEKPTFFRQINVFTKEVTKELISQKIFEHEIVL